jgi:galactonate dehydratase
MAQWDIQDKPSGITRRGMIQTVAGALAANELMPLSAAGEVGRMKITELKTFVVGNPWKNWIFVKVNTDQGLVGWGEATGGLETKGPEAQVLELGRFVIGEDPLHPERLWQKMHKGLFLGSNIAMNGITIACWDILAKSLNVPLWKLLGGKQNTSLRVYANGWYKGPREPGAFAEEAARVKSMGYTALKFDPFGTTYRFFGAGEEKKSLDIVAAVRKAVGDDVDILIEAHDRFSVSTAIRVGKELEEYRPMWLETPVMSTDIEATLQVARAIKVPVATGERFNRLGQFLDLLAGRAVDIVQPETLGIGGIGGALKAAALAQAAEAFVALHQAQSPYNTAINAHLHAVMPNFLIQECFDDFLEPWVRDFMHGVPQVKDGSLEPSDAPGIGVTFDEIAMAKHPYGPNNFLRLFENGWERRTGGSPE